MSDTCEVWAEQQTRAVTHVSTLKLHQIYVLDNDSNTFNTMYTIKICHTIYKTLLLKQGFYFKARSGRLIEYLTIC